MIREKEQMLLNWMPDWVGQVIERLNQAGFEAYVVGGCVRDALLGREPHDWDICTPALPQEVISCFPERKVHLTGIQHGTVLLIWEGEGVEITTFRTEEGYSDHRHPDQVTFVRNLEEDLARRDFTVNAMAYHPQRGIIDPFGGRQDLRKKVIRCVGVPKRRFQEDGLRILRALRFAAHYGFSIEAETGIAMNQCKELLNQIAIERVWEELKGFLCGVQVKSLMLRYREILAVCLPEICPTFDFDQRNNNHCYDAWEHIACSVANVAPEPVLRLAMLFHDIGKPACFALDDRGVGHCIGHSIVSARIGDAALTRLRCDRATRQAVVELIEQHERTQFFTRRSTCRLLSELGVVQTKRLLQVMEADVKAQAPETVVPKMEALLIGFAKVDAVLAARGCFTKKSMALKGGDLLSLGLRPGIHLGSVLDQVFRLVLDGELENRKDLLLEKAKELIAKETADCT